MEECNSELQIYLNLASRVNVCGPNQLWIADITYVQLKTEFVYLAVVLDAFSRGVVGWSVDRSLQARLPTRGNVPHTGMKKVSRVQVRE